MEIDKTNLTEEESLIADTCENAINQMYSACFGALAVLKNSELYEKIKDKLPKEQQDKIDNIITKADELNEAIK